ncbi:MAG: ubiquinol-cytochrome c reductase iron-sulfur subunit [Pirellulales bacterium]
MNEPDARRLARPAVAGVHVPLPVDARRGFLAKVAAVCCGGIATLVPVAAGVWTFLDPLGRRGTNATFLPVADLAAIPDDGVPRQYPVITDRTDAWTGFAAEPVGAVYLRREKGATEVQALSATCPHAGCFVEMEPTGRCFRCPCHNSTFAVDGSIVAPSPSPRPMDALDCRIDGNGAVEVKWEKFRAGIAGKEVQG